MADPATYRTRDEVEQFKKLDPIDVLVTAMRKRGMEVSAADMEAMEADVAGVVQRSIEASENGPSPDPDVIWDDVYASREDPALLRDV
jgi:pyruvate dehydrogenase E1 component alpha subunit